jgi:hypothetical protein
MLTSAKINHFELTSGDYSYSRVDSYSGMPAYDETEVYNIQLEPGEVQMSYSIYNKIFGTMYSSTNYDLSVNNTFTLKLYNYVDGEKIVVYSKDFKIVGISTSTFFDVEDFAEIISYNKVDYSLYIENTEKTKDMISYGNEHSFYLKTSDFESGLVINKLTSTFNTLFTIILICIYVVFATFIEYMIVFIIFKIHEIVVLSNSIVIIC